ncbi:MAG: DUF3306 domain-containing protein [Paracoccaceae bacterium]
MSGPEKDQTEEGFLSRWSKRKLDGIEEPAPEPEITAPEPVEDKSDEEVLDELGLRDPDDLQEGDDFSGFMNGAVPTRLRNRALRKLWLTNPVLANIDELVDYGEDFTDAATVIENMQTAYQVGKGWLPEEPIETDESATSENAEEDADEALANAGARCEADETFPADEKSDTVSAALTHETDPETGADMALASPPEPEMMAEKPLPTPRKIRFRLETR